MARVTLLIGLTNGLEVDCPVNSREEAEQVMKNLNENDNLQKLPGVCFVRRSGANELGARGIVHVHPDQIAYTQMLGVDDE
ncbi:MAG: hypothetical protein KIT45_10465 [Fimbriimonadia bacterium]|nr:hypothetical protein [Fimbriimonadia bacterium]